MTVKGLHVRMQIEEESVVVVVLLLLLLLLPLFPNMQCAAKPLTCFFLMTTCVTCDV